ncbi:MAG TPA: hypothetical protein V6D29_23145 [Leptolyngbyaceae cyanobacterium]
MNKLPECDRCTLLRNQVCQLYPEGPGGGDCMDFRPQFPEEYGSYLGQVITDLPKYSQEELGRRLAQHPVFTGRCPQCGKGIAQTEPPQIHWDCRACGWVDDSL